MSLVEDFARLDVIIDLFRKESSKSRMADPRGQVFAKHDSYFYSPEDVREYLDQWRAARAKDGDEFQGIVVKDPNEDINPDKEIEDKQWEAFDGVDPQDEDEEDEDDEEEVPQPIAAPVEPTLRFNMTPATEEEKANFRADQAKKKAQKEAADRAGAAAPPPRIAEITPAERAEIAARQAVRKATKVVAAPPPPPQEQPATRQAMRKPTMMDGPPLPFGAAGTAPAPVVAREPTQSQSAALPLQGPTDEQRAAAVARQAARKAAKATAGPK